MEGKSYLPTFEEMFGESKSPRSTVLHQEKEEEMSIKSKLSHYRILHGVTQQDLADLLRINVSTLYRLEQNKITKSFDGWAKIARLMGCKMSDICQTDD